MLTVSVWNFSATKASNSTSVSSTTSSIPPSSAGLICGITTRQNVRHAPRPSERAVSSSAGSITRSDAATSRNTIG